MKTFTEFLKEDYEFDEISSELLEICETRRWSNFSYHIFEGSGVFDGAKKIAYLISRIIKRNFKQNKEFSFSLGPDKLIDIKHKDFFDIVTINVVKSDLWYKDFKGSGEYNSKSIENLWVNDRFSMISIDVELPIDFFNNEDFCTDIVEHELNHAYKDYCRRLKEKSTAIDTAKRNAFIKKHNLEDEASVIKNYLNNDECISYIAQLDGEIGNRKFRTYKEAVKWLDTSNTWKIYKDLKNYCMGSDKLFSLFRKSWKKFDNHVWHLLEDHVSNNKVYEYASREFIPIKEIKILEDISKTICIE